MNLFTDHARLWTRRIDISSPHNRAHAMQMVRLLSFFHTSSSKNEVNDNDLRDSC